MALPSPGWYPDPSGAPGKRYWNGVRWGRREGSPITPWVVAAVIGVVLVLIVIVALEARAHDNPVQDRARAQWCQAYDRTQIDLQYVSLNTLAVLLKQSLPPLQAAAKEVQDAGMREAGGAQFYVKAIQGVQAAADVGDPGGVIDGTRIANSISSLPPC